MAAPNVASPVALMTAPWGQAVCSEKLGDVQAAAAAYRDCGQWHRDGRAAIAAQRVEALRNR